VLELENIKNSIYSIITPTKDKKQQIIKIEFTIDNNNIDDDEKNKHYLSNNSSTEKLFPLLTDMEFRWTDR
jgi:hypothetical protein